MSELKRILYVEDDPDIRAVARIALETIGGFDVEMCVSGEDALEKVLGFTPDLFLLDVMMPGIDGTETLIELRKLPGMTDIPAMFMTAKIQPNELEELKAMNVLEVISKPFDAINLAAQLRSLWTQHQSATS